MKPLQNLILSILILCAVNINAQENYFTVSGVIKDNSTRQPLEYVTIRVVNYNIGTVSNADGGFNLKIPKNLNSVVVEFSHLGYRSFTLPVKGENTNGVEILLTPYTVLLKELTVYGGDARNIVEEAVKKIPKNYCSSLSQLTGFYRETVQKKRNYINISEAVVDLYKTPYSEKADHDRLQILKGRKLLSQKVSDTLSVKLLGGPNLAVILDIVKNPDILIDVETLGYYSFSLENITQINDRDQFVITFKPRVIVEYPLYVGTLYIDRESLSFTRAEFGFDMNDRKKVSDMILKKKPIGLRFSPENVSFVVSYQLREDVSYLSYIRNEIKFSCDWKKRLFSTNYEIISEMVITDINLQNVTIIPRKEAFNSYQVLNDKLMDFYDDDFWGAYNIIEPTESLEIAVSKLKKKQ